MSIKKYWWIGLLFLVLPVVINFVLLIPAFTPIVGDNTIWLGFWGSYLGAIISAGVAFVILAIQHKQNREENKRNRDLQIEENKRNRLLQINVIKHQQEQARLNRIIEISAKLIASTNLAKVAEISGKIGKVGYDVVALLDDIVRDIDNHKNELDLYLKKSEKEFLENLDDDFFTFTCALNDISNVVYLFDLRKGNVTVSELKSYLSECVLEEMQTLAVEYAEALGHALGYRDCSIIVHKRLDLMLDLKCKIDNSLRDYISAEKASINNILVEDSTKDVK